MSRFIEVKDRYYGNKTTININDIVSITESYGKATIWIRGKKNPFEAVESYDEICEQIKAGEHEWMS